MIRRCAFASQNGSRLLPGTTIADAIRSLHTNGSENDIRCQVTRRKISGGTRSDTGRDCRDAFLSLAKTCAKLGISFWDYLGDRLAVSDHPPVPYLPDLVMHRCHSA